MSESTAMFLPSSGPSILRPAGRPHLKLVPRTTEPVLPRIRQGLSDAILAQRAQAGDEAAFATLVARHEKALIQALYAKVKDKDVARDLAQDAILRVRKNLHHFDGRSFAGWFFRVATNLAFSLLRRRSLEQRTLNAGIGAPEARAEEQDPFEQVSRGEEVALLRGALDELSDRHQEILALRYRDGLRCFEIAERLGTTANSVSIVLHRAKKRLKDAYLERGGRQPF